MTLGMICDRTVDGEGLLCFLLLLLLLLLLWLLLLR